MLQKLNERIQGVVAWLVVIIIGITFTLFGVDYYMQAHQTSNSKAIVNGQRLAEQAFETNYRRARAAQDMAQMTAADEKQLQNQVLEQMITNEIMVQAARKNGFEISPGQADAAIVSIPQFQEDGRFSTEKYQQALSAALFTQSSFQKEVRQGMLLNQLRFAFIGSSFALPDEVERFVTLYMQRRDYDYLTIPTSHFEKGAQVSDTAIADYYKSHKKEFMAPEQVSLDYIILSMRQIKKSIKVSDEDIKHYYDENQNNYLTPARWKVAHILFAIPEDISMSDLDAIQKKAEDTYAVLQKDPKQFDALVKALSDDKLSLADKGKLPWITAGQKDYDKILSSLTTPGEISAPEKTKFGYEIFKLIAYKPATIKPLADVKVTIKEQLIADMAQAQYAQALEQLSDLSYQSPDSLNPAADALKLTIRQSALFSRSGGSDKLTSNKPLVNAAFSHDVLELGNNSEPVQLDNDSVAVIRVREHRLAEEQPLDIVRAQINTILIKQMTDAKAKAFGMELLNPMEDPQQREQLVAHNLKWNSVINASREGDGNNVLINDVAFNLLRPESREGMVLPNGDYVVVRLRQIHDGVFSALDREQQDSLIQQIEASYGTMDYDLYAKSLVNQAQVERH